MARALLSSSAREESLMADLPSSLSASSALGPAPLPTAANRRCPLPHGRSRRPLLLHGSGSAQATTPMAPLLLPSVVSNTPSCSAQPWRLQISVPWLFPKLQQVPNTFPMASLSISSPGGCRFSL
ncbi:hypothetical protein Zm00014a_036446 [Zea mays]|uniref:Uncharacterized protein n=1 Tax=Zea mays TaxID=4577 RepID=A0A3L6G3W5_MAIZE|nr:hypothetical protein Zm00014a_036446 [Zea mays]